MDYDVLLIGDYYFDVVVTGLPRMPGLGEEVFGSGLDVRAGGAFNTAAALHSLGLHVGWVADFGNDPLSRFVLAAGRAQGLDDRLFLVHDSPFRRFTLSASFPSDRAMISFADPLEAPSPASRRLDGVHAAVAVLGSLTIGRAFQDLKDSLQGRTGAIIMDCQDTDATIFDPDVREAIGGVDVFMPNESEAMKITGVEDTRAAIAVLSALCPILVVKAGSNGAYAAACGRVLHSPARPVHAAETTGAGDCFNAGFIAAWLEGRSIEGCLARGNECAGQWVAGRNIT